MSELVLDASVAVRALTALDDSGVDLQARLSEDDCLAPHLIDAEVGMFYYDALYVALAARLNIPLLTADARLARAPGLPCAVEVIS